jgi:membrane-bound ClpP family serine protease
MQIDTTFALILTGLVLFLLEIITPGGILAAIGVVLLSVASFLVMVDAGLLAGFLMFVATLLLAISLFFIEIRLLERNPWIRFVRTDGRVEGSVREDATRADLVGKQGRTITTLAPLGKVEIDGALHEASSTGDLLRAETPVEVIRIEAYRLIVKPVEPGPA